jgi:hypothetical protein
MDEKIAMMILVLSFIAAIVTILKAGLDHLKRSKTERLQFDLYNKVLDKFGSNTDLVAWLQNEGAQGLLKAVEAPKPMAYSRILNAVQAGLLAVVLGAGFMAVSTQLPTPDKSKERAIAASIDKQMELDIAREERRDREEASAVNAFGILIMTAGLGLLAGGGASYFLSRRFRLINGGSAGGPDKG